MSKLERLLFLQGNRCFFCDQPIPPGEATVEHLRPKSKGGGQEDDNCVVCCRTMNVMLGNLSVKDKMRALLAQRGQIICPARRLRTSAECAESDTPRAEAIESDDTHTTPSPTEQPETQPSQPFDYTDDVMEVLAQRFKYRPKKRKSLRNLIRTIVGEDEPDETLDNVILDLERLQYLRIDGEKVKYFSDACEDIGETAPKPNHVVASVDEDIPF